MLPDFLRAVHRFEELPSTQDEALARLAAGERDFVVLARAQSAGRGRRGRAWTTPPGSAFMATFGLALPPGKPAGEALFPLALAAADAAETFLPPSAPRVKIKWPNDLWADGKKLAGLLGESRVAADGAALCALGIGVNLGQHANEFPPDLQDMAISLAMLGAGSPPDPEQFLAVLAPRFSARLARWLTGGLDALRAEYAARSLFQDGDSIRLEQDGESLQGVCRGLAPDGALRVEIAGSVRLIRAADAFQVRCG